MDIRIVCDQRKELDQPRIAFRGLDLRELRLELDARLLNAHDVPVHLSQALQSDALVAVQREDLVLLLELTQALLLRRHLSPQAGDLLADPARGGLG